MTTLLNPATLELPLRPLAAARLQAARDWKSRAIASYQRALGHEEQIMRAALARRLRALLGVTVPHESIWVDLNARMAGVTLDGVRFRLNHTQLVLLRTCAHCDSGEFASPPLHTAEDVGYALTAWEPHHPACQPEDPANWLENDL
jgi:hypothetical protein